MLLPNGYVPGQDTLRTQADDEGDALQKAASLLSLLFLVGIALLKWAPETKGTELPE